MIIKTIAGTKSVYLTKIKINKNNSKRSKSILNYYVRVTTIYIKITAIFNFTSNK